MLDTAKGARQEKCCGLVFAGAVSFLFAHCALPADGMTSRKSKLRTRTHRRSHIGVLAARSKSEWALCAPTKLC